jgi:phosphoketolase
VAVVSDAERKLVNAYWRAANYPTLGQIYLLENPRQKKRLRPITRSGWIPKMGGVADHVRQEMRAKLVEYPEYITRHGEDLPEVRDWKWDL